MRTRTISRRTLLRGLGGAALALPFLEIMERPGAKGQDIASPRRFLVWSMPNGTVTDHWRPRAGVDEFDFELSEILSPLERHKGDLVVIQHLMQFGGHAHHWVSSLTGRGPGGGAFPELIARGISVDQYLAGKIGGESSVPSLQLGCQVTQNRETVGCASWAGPGQPLPAENNPYLVFGKLFGDGTPGSVDAIAKQLARRKSILDSVKEQSASLSRSLGSADQKILDGYLSSVRDLEVRLDRLAQGRAQCSTSDVPTDPSADPNQPVWLDRRRVPEVMEVFRRLITAAFACDRTRVITFAVSNDGGAFRMHEWIAGIDHGKDWHGHSHAVELGDRASETAIQKWYYEELARLVDAFKETPEADGTTLLDHSLLFVNNEYGPNGPVDYLAPDNNLSHYARLMPYSLIGRAGGALRTGRNLIYPILGNPREVMGPDHTQLLVSILNLMGVPDQEFGDPEAMQGPLPGLA